MNHDLYLSVHDPFRSPDRGARCPALACLLRELNLQEEHPEGCGAAPERSEETKA
jgi:hypothetical protein